MPERDIICAVRAYRRWCAANLDWFVDLDRFQAADQAICPELWRGYQSRYAVTMDGRDERALEVIAGCFGLSPGALDDAVQAHANDSRWAQ